jgi:uncharacterized protein YdeI (YjbR/CyaY-like superfamily)
MKSLSRILSAAGLAMGLALTAVPADAQQKNAPAAPAATPLKPASPAALAAAKEILTMKNASAMYANAVPNLVQQTKNVQSARQIRFTSAKEVTAQAAVIKAYILEAIEAEKSGAKIEYKQTEDFDLAPEFAARLRSTPSLKAAFDALTPGRQRGYLLYFAGAKQSETRAARVEKCAPAIHAGKGLND